MIDTCLPADEEALSQKTVKYIQMRVQLSKGEMAKTLFSSVQETISSTDE